MKFLSTLFLVLNLVFHAQAQNTTTPSPIIFICDASGSMWGQIDGKTKMSIATAVLTETVDKLPDNQQIGLVAYGHRAKGDCKDVAFLVEVEKGGKAAVTQSLKGIKPLGMTPLAYSALQVIDKLRQSKMKATIILVTDGIESCDGNICEVIKAAKKEGIDFKLHIIGFGLKADETAQLKCAAAAGDGKYYDAANAGGLGEVLNEATSVTVDSPKPNYSVHVLSNKKPTDAYIEAFVAGTKDKIATVRSYRDTAFFYLPPGKYDLNVKPLEGSDVKAMRIENIESMADTMLHKTLSFDGGLLTITALNNEVPLDALVKIFSKADGKQVASGRTYSRTDEFMLNPGMYDVTIDALKIDGLDKNYRIENVEIKAGETQAVRHNFQSGIASIGIKNAAGLLDCMVNIFEVKSNKNVSGARTYTSSSSNPKTFVLSPGNYTVKVMVVAKEYKGKTETFPMEIKAGQTFEKMLSF